MHMVQVIKQAGKRGDFKVMFIDQHACMGLLRRAWISDIRTGFIWGGGHQDPSGEHVYLQKKFIKFFSCKVAY